MGRADQPCTRRFLGRVIRPFWSNCLAATVYSSGRDFALSHVAGYVRRPGYSPVPVIRLNIEQRLAESICSFGLGSLAGAVPPQRCGCPAPAGGTATAAPSAAEPSNPLPSCYPIGPPRSWPTCRPGSPGWSPTASPPSCWVSCYRWAGAYTPRWSAARPRPWPSGWRTSSVMNGSTSSTPASASREERRARTCRWSSGSTGATSTPPRSAPVATAGSR